ncbi:MAG TPA: glycerol-3-phosphate dehydrogenase/oxidase [Planktothrix sp.]|jgi:glycerol-3-phosphate dehydrogenase
MSTKPLRRPASKELSGREFDLIVIGGGITGAGIALDAASRGLSTILFEKGDFASGTSSKSTKLVHGGLRYLQNLQFAVTLESVRERELLEKLAPHMVWRLPFVIPQYRGKRFKNMKVRAGLSLYDLMAGSGKNGSHKRLTPAEVLSACPGIRVDGLLGGLRYYDCRTDDARYTLEVIKTACEHGALAMNHAQVVNLSRRKGTVYGVEVHDRAAGAASANFTVRGKVVVNATGVWSQQTAQLSGGKSLLEVAPAKGVHIALKQSRLPITDAILVDSVHDDRFCFAVPWYDSVIVGTTDTPYDGDLDNVQAEPEEVLYILDALNAQFPFARLTLGDVTATFAGLRPLVREKGKGSSAEVSRKHSLITAQDGVISIAGGKLTTYRPMASETVDAVFQRLTTLDAARKIVPSTTDKIMVGCEAGVDGLEQLSEFAQGAKLPNETLALLYSMYGKRATEVVALMKERPELGKRISVGHSYIVAQIVYAVQNEAACTIDDVLSRRIRLTITDNQGALQSADLVSRVMAQELKWDERRRNGQKDWFTTRYKRG